MTNMDVMNALNVGLRLGLSGSEIAERLNMSELKLRAHCAAAYDEIFEGALKNLGFDPKEPCAPMIKIGKNGVATSV